MFKPAQVFILFIVLHYLVYIWAPACIYMSPALILINTVIYRKSPFYCTGFYWEIGSESMKEWRNYYRCFLIICQANYKKKESWWLDKVGIISELNAFLATLNRWLEVCGVTQDHIGYLLWNSVILRAIIVFKPNLSLRELKLGWICNPVAFDPPCIQALHQLSSETLLLAVIIEWLNPLNTLHGELATSLLLTGEEYI